MGLGKEKWQGQHIPAPLGVSITNSKSSARFNGIPSIFFPVPESPLLAVISSDILVHAAWDK
jgi:hypothetical protein